PTTSSRRRGRMRSASGTSEGSRCQARSKRSSLAWDCTVRGSLPGVTRRAAPTAPVTGRKRLVLGLAVALAAAAGAGCDDKFQSFLLKTSDRHVEREQKKLEDAERRARNAAAISAPVRRAIHLVRTSDYDFVAVKSDGTRRRYSGYDFAAM